jgi:hypothetical protein
MAAATAAANGSGEYPAASKESPIIKLTANGNDNGERRTGEGAAELERGNEPGGRAVFNGALVH